MNGIKSLLLAASRVPGVAAELASGALRDFDVLDDVVSPTGGALGDLTGLDDPPDGRSRGEHTAPPRSAPPPAPPPAPEPRTEQA